MDDIVKQAIAKWPNVPHCYGWLALDARGNWRMRDQRTQALNLIGDRIANPALLAFINRNYLHDDKGRWYFQNGPQRVYVNLDATPYIARTDPQHGFVLHTGDPLSTIDAGWFTDDGRLLLQRENRIATLDDRDLAQCLPTLLCDGLPVRDETLLAWLENRGMAGELALRRDGERIPLQFIAQTEVATHFGFEREPRPDAT